MREIIWNELTQARHSMEFCSLYSERQRKYLRVFNIGVLVFSTSGIFGWFMWKNSSLIACCIISAVSLLRLLQTQLIMDEKQIANIDRIEKFYIGHYWNLEQLWLVINNDKDGSKVTSVTEKLHQLRNGEAEIITIINETIRTKPKSLVTKAKVHSDDHFKRVFNATC